MWVRSGRNAALALIGATVARRRHDASPFAARKTRSWRRQQTFGCVGRGRPSTAISPAPNGRQGEGYRTCFEAVGLAQLMRERSREDKGVAPPQGCVYLFLNNVPIYCYDAGLQTCAFATSAA